MKQFIEMPQGEEIVLINVNHISAIETVTFGEKQLCKIYVSTPHQRDGWVAETGCNNPIQFFTLSSSPADRRSSLEVLPSRMNSTQA